MNGDPIPPNSDRHHLIALAILHPLAPTLATAKL